MTQNPSDPRPPLTRPEEAASLCERLQEVAAQMTDLLAQETALLKANRPREISTLQEEKTRLSYSYARDYGVLKANARFVGAKAPNQVDRLRRALKTLQTEIQRNYTALEAFRAVSQGLLNAIYEIAKSRTGGPNCYTSAASMAIHKPSTPTALTVDRSL